MFFKRLGLAVIALFLISGCSKPEPTFDAMYYLEPTSHIQDYSDPEDSPPSSSWINDIPIYQREIIDDYQDYMETDAFKDFVECVDYGRTLDLELRAYETEYDLKRLADITIQAGERFLSQDVDLEVEFKGETYQNLNEMHDEQVKCVEAYINGAEAAKEYLDTERDDDQLKAKIFFDAANECFFKVRDIMDDFDYDPVFDPIDEAVDKYHARHALDNIGS